MSLIKAKTFVCLVHYSGHVYFAYCIGNWFIIISLLFVCLERSCRVVCLLDLWVAVQVEDTKCLVKKQRLQSCCFLLVHAIKASVATTVCFHFLVFGFIIWKAFWNRFKLNEMSDFLCVCSLAIRSFGLRV